MSAPNILRSVLLFSAVALATLAGRECKAARIEADPAKQYHLTKQHGPWMIMVASFHTTGQDGETDVGKTPEQVAGELVLELRKEGIPAYTYAVENGPEFYNTTDRLGQQVRRKNMRRVKSLCVIAGNYPSSDDDVAQQTLDWIKRFEPKCLQEGVGYRPTPGRPRPLSGAFLTISPLLNPEEVAHTTTDPLLLRLNSGQRFSLADNPGKYTLVVANFGGKSVTQLKGQPESFNFLKDNDLDDAAQLANDLAAVLRQDLDPAGQFRNIDAYVWHDRYESMVCVGSFSSPNDPAIEHFRRKFGASVDPQTNQLKFKFLTLDTGAGQGTRMWTFVPTPQVMRVPKLR
jgi:hypothetical protein